MDIRLSVRAGLAILPLIFPLSAWAVLGGTAASVQSDQTSMKAAVRPGTSQSQYSVHAFQTPAGVTVKEYVSGNGDVFAVTWQGPIMPDLKQLLGQYFTNYATAARNRRGGHHHMMISQPGLVVQARGHMRAFSGLAYLPAKLPTGVKPSDLQ